MSAESDVRVNTGDEGARRRVIAALLGAKRVVITGHVRPDGDATGAALGLAGYLRGVGVEAVVVGLAPMPESLHFLDGVGEIVPAQHYREREGDVLCLVDCAAEDRLQFPLRPYFRKLPLVIIDHHWPREAYPTEAVYAIPDISSTCELIWSLAATAGWVATREIAEALWTGILTDTNRFAYPCTTPETLRVAAGLLKVGGVRTQRIADESYNLISEKRLRLQTRMMSRIRLLCGGRLSIGYLTQEDYAAEDATSADSNNFVDIPRFIRGVEIAAFLYPGRNGEATCLSLRTSTDAQNAAEFCGQWRGGGHARASGATIDLPMAEALPMLTEALTRFAERTVSAT